MSEIDVTEKNFEKEVMKSKKLVLLDFWASWCVPCGVFSSVLEEIKEEHQEIKICKVNVDEQKELTASFNVESIPSVFIIKDGEVVNSFSGYRSKEDVLEMLQV